MILLNKKILLQNACKRIIVKGTLKKDAEMEDDSEVNSIFQIWRNQVLPVKSDDFPELNNESANCNNNYQENVPLKDLNVQLKKQKSELNGHK